MKMFQLLSSVWGHTQKIQKLASNLRKWGFGVEFVWFNDSLQNAYWWLKFFAKDSTNVLVSIKLCMQPVRDFSGIEEMVFTPWTSKIAYILGRL